MGLMRAIFSLTAAVFLLVACSQVEPVDWSTVPGSGSYMLEYTAGKVPKQRRLNLRESEKALLRTYLQELAREAEMSFVTYAPRLVVTGENYSLNFTDDVVVLNIWDSDRKNAWQYARRCCEADDEVLELLRRRTAARSLSR